MGKESMGELGVNDSSRNTNGVDRPAEGGLSAKALKWIAMITMAVDHAAIAIVIPAFNFGYFANLPLEPLYYCMRSIGRLAFPLFVYLIVDSFFYTRDRKRFAAGLLVFALISEIPFDIAIFLSPYDTYNTIGNYFSYQNVYFTLFIGTLCLMFSEFVFHGTPAFISDREVQDRRNQEGQDDLKHSKVFNFLMVLLITVLGCVLAYVLRVDYGIYGVLAMVAAYLIRKTGKKKLEIFGIILILTLNSIFELIALPDCLLVFASNGKRGNIHHKWLYYIFYPAHLAVLAGIKLAILKMAGVY